MDPYSSPYILPKNEKRERAHLGCCVADHRDANSFEALIQDSYDHCSSAWKGRDAGPPCVGDVGANYMSTR